MKLTIHSVKFFPGVLVRTLGLRNGKKMNRKHNIKLFDISKEYAIANLVILAILSLLFIMPYVFILVEKFKQIPMSTFTPECFIKLNTGKPCSTCGLTRSIILLYKGQFEKSIFQYAYGYIFLLLLSAQFFLRFIPIFGRHIFIPYMDITQMILFAILWSSIVH
jgi:Protein of unknown function (DUF2752)